MGDQGGLKLIRNLVAKGYYRYSDKVDRNLKKGNYTPEDIELCIHNGTVYKTQKDKLHNSVGNKIYIIIGKDTHGYEFYTKGKIIRTSKKSIYFFITAHHCE